MTRSLPKSPDLTLLKKQAKQLLKQFKDSANAPLHQQAKVTIQQYHPKPETFSGLRDAQLVLARSYGFNDWSELSHGVDMALIQLTSNQEQAELLIRLACVQYAGNDSVLNYRRANRLLAAHPALAFHDFYTALVSNNVNAVTQYLNKDKSLAVNTGGLLNWPPLLYVTYSRIEGHKESAEAIAIVKLLLEYGADPNSFVLLNDTYHFSALTGAIGEGEGGVVHQPPHQYARELAEILLKAGAKPNDSQGLYNTIFADKSIDWLKLLMAYGLNAQHEVNWSRDKQKQTMFDFLLAYAVKQGFEERVDFLLKHGANPNTMDHYDKQSIYTLSLIMGFPSIAKALLKHGANSDELSDEDRFKQAIACNDIARIDSMLADQPALLSNTVFIHHAALRSGFATVLHLLSLGADINSLSNDGRTLLHVYAWEDDIKAVTTLIDLGADAEIKDSTHQSNPLGHAIYNRATRVMYYLLACSNDIIEVVCCAHIDRLKVLLEKDPELIQTCTQRGNTLMHIIGFSLEGELEDQHYTDIVDYLISLGMDINIKNTEGLTPLDFAHQVCNDQLADIFIERGGVTT
ncbi:MAG: ankyrin repeat domain-containing protein [Cellvibrionaceae bacterium]